MFKRMSSVLLLAIFSLHWVNAQDNPAYVIYNKAGRKSSFSKMEKAILEKKIVFFGESHNDPIAHWIQFLVLESLFEKHGEQLLVGSEMFERDNQNILDAYQKGDLTAKQFEDSCRLWTNYKTDYKPMLLYANQHTIPWVATNIPRRYASMVFKKGLQALDTLSIDQKKWICPLPFPLDTTLTQYAALLDDEMHMGPTFVQAQAIKDATMAYSIAQALKPTTVFYHLNGSYHSDFHQGILWYLARYSSLRFGDMITISIVSQDNIQHLSREYIGKADFIICVPETMTKTH